jgi:hypothetical protein
MMPLSEHLVSLTCVLKFRDSPSRNRSSRKPPLQFFLRLLQVLAFSRLWFFFLMMAAVGPAFAQRAGCSVSVDKAIINNDERLDTPFLTGSLFFSTNSGSPKRCPLDDVVQSVGSKLLRNKRCRASPFSARACPFDLQIRPLISMESPLSLLAIQVSLSFLMEWSSRVSLRSVLSICDTMLQFDFATITALFAMSILWPARRHLCFSRIISKKTHLQKWIKWAMLTLFISMSPNCVTGQTVSAL